MHELATVLPGFGRLPTRLSPLVGMIACASVVAGLPSQDPTNRAPSVAQRDAARSFVNVVALGEGEVLDGDHGEVNDFATRYSVDTVRSLLAHEVSQVRAVAAAVLQLQLGAKALPDLLPLLDDRGSAPINPDVGSVGPDFEHVDSQVGQLVAAILRHYLVVSGVKVDREPKALRDAFAEYWRVREARSQCLSWHKVRFQQAGGGPGPQSSNVEERVAQLREVIDAHPDPERSWYLLALGSPWRAGGRAAGAEHLTTDAELIEMVRSLRAIRGDVNPLLELLAGRGPADSSPGSGDPDLSREGTLPLEQIVCFALRNAPKILNPEDLPRLRALTSAHLQIGMTKRVVAEDAKSASTGVATIHGDPIRTSLWCVAAAGLDPKNASEHVARGFAVFATNDRWLDQHERMHLADAAWRLLGEDGKRMAVDWFFTDVPPHAMVGRIPFANTLVAKDREALLWTLAVDSRAATLDPSTARALAEAAHQHLGETSPFDEADFLGMRVPPETVAAWLSSLRKIGKERLAAGSSSVGK